MLIEHFHFQLLLLFSKRVRWFWLNISIFNWKGNSCSALAGKLLKDEDIDALISFSAAKLTFLALDWLPQLWCRRIWIGLSALVYKRRMYVLISKSIHVQQTLHIYEHTPNTCVYEIILESENCYICVCVVCAHMLLYLPLQFASTIHLIL